ncbi:hypothetical protein ACFX1W_039330 [Malus domestica]
MMSSLAISSFALSGDEAMAGAGKGPFVSSMREKPNFLMRSLAISSFALSDGWYSSQNIYLLLSLHNTGAGKHVKAGQILPNEELCESALLNPAMTNHISLSDLSEGYPSIGDKAQTILLAPLESYSDKKCQLPTIHFFSIQKQRLWIPHACHGTSKTK